MAKRTAEEKRVWREKMGSLAAKIRNMTEAEKISIAEQTEEGQ